jgi:cellulose synthase/poly-beta-1,6-N-acetylglucosamine synthase-like glycosyltransferase
LVAVIVVLYIAAFTGLHIATLAGVLRGFSREKRLLGLQTGGFGEAGDAPAVSVIVPVRNEEARLPGLLKSLDEQDYQNIEFVFIDDCSNDSTPQLLAAFAAKKTKIITLTENPAPNRKQAALGRGIDEANGSLLLFTDADCEMGPSWASTLVSFFRADTKTGIVLGPVYKKPPPATEKHSLMTSYECHDHAVRYMYIAGAAGLGAASGGFGNNIAVRRDALEAAGGYAAIPFSITEDAALIAAVRSLTGYAVIAVWNERASVLTRRETSWKALLNQTLRWHKGSLSSDDAVTRSSFMALAILILAGVLAYPFALIHPAFLLLPLDVFFCCFFSNLPTRILSGKRLPGSFGGFVFMSFFTEYYFSLLTLLCILGKKPKWVR